MSLFSDYLHSIRRVNGLGNGQDVEWLFHCGMLFSSMDKWWGDFKYRHAPHEGIDITCFRTQSDQLLCFDDSIKVPAMANGILINICDDFLGQSLVIQHKDAGLNGQVLFIYSHITPEKALRTGQTVQKGSIIATVCDTNKNRHLLPHLHFSCIEVPFRIQPEKLDWNLFTKNRNIHLIHPVFL